MNRKPRILFLAFYFPPLHTIASVRGANIARRLSDIGWDVSVVTLHPDLLESPDDPDRVAAEMDRWGVHRIYTGHRWRCLSSGMLKQPRHGVRWLLGGIARRVARRLGVDEMAGWYPEAKRACAKLKPEDVDIILATGGPFGTFRVAQQLSRRLNRPFVLDYRDLWTGNPHGELRDQNRCREIEQELLEECAAVSTVSPSMAQYLNDHFGVANKTHVITNGYEPTDFERIAPAVFGHFAIVYTGIFLPPKRDVGPLMRVLQRLEQIEPSRPWRFHYYGPWQDYVRQTAQTHRIEHRVELHDSVPRAECLAAIRGAGAAVVIASVYDVGDLADRSIVPGKIFEPIGMGTPVLVMAPPGSDLETIVRSVGKGAVYRGSNSDDMAEFLAGLMRNASLDDGKRDLYAWPNLILKLDALLRRAMEPKET